jgi:hypothetical protein
MLERQRHEFVQYAFLKEVSACLTPASTLE